MTTALGHPADLSMPQYRRGCKPGHRPLRFRGDDGACLKCGRQEPPDERLAPELLAAQARRRHARDGGGLGLLDEAVAQTAMKLRALALLDDVDPTDRDGYGAWLEAQRREVATVDERLRAHAEDEVRWAVRAAYV